MIDCNRSCTSSKQNKIDTSSMRKKKRKVQSTRDINSYKYQTKREMLPRIKRLERQIKESLHQKIQIS